MDWWTNFYHFGLVLNKLFNIVHAFSICVLCCSKLINYYKLKILFFLSKTQEKGLKNKQRNSVQTTDRSEYNSKEQMRGKGKGRGLGLCAIEWRLREGDRRQTTNGAWSEYNFPRTRFPRIARAFTFDLETPPKKCTHLTPLSRRLILLTHTALW